MKILWFTNNTVNLSKDTTRGGWMQRLAQELSQDQEIQLYIATRYNGKTKRSIVEQNAHYILIPDQRNLLQKRMDIFLNREPTDRRVQHYIKVIAEVQPDIIQVFGTEMDYGLVSNLTSIPVVIHIQGILHPYYYHLAKIQVPFFKKLLSNKIIDFIKGSTIQNSMMIFKKWVRIEEEILKTCCYFIGRTDWDRQVIMILSPNANYFHCDEMLRQDFFNTEWEGCPTETIHIVSTISNPLYKGHETLIATCWVLKKAGIPFIWHIIGLNEHTTAYRIFYKDNLKKGLADHLRLHGELQPEAMIKILQHTNVYVHPSHIENSSNSICEAMALGMPVIALLTGGNASLIEHGVDGLLVADYDPYVLAATIRQLAFDPAESQRLGRNARVRAAARHDPTQIINALKAIYSQVIELHAHPA